MRFAGRQMTRCAAPPVPECEAQQLPQKEKLSVSVTCRPNVEVVLENNQQNIKILISFTPDNAEENIETMFSHKCISIILIHLSLTSTTVPQLSPAYLSLLLSPLVL